MSSRNDSGRRCGDPERRSTRRLVRRGRISPRRGRARERVSRAAADSRAEPRRGGLAAAPRASSSWRRMAICDTAALRSTPRLAGARDASPAPDLASSGRSSRALIASSRRTASISACRSPSRAAFERSRIWATVSKARAARASARESLTSKRSIAESKESGILGRSRFPRGRVSPRDALEASRGRVEPHRPRASSSSGRARCSSAAWPAIASSSQSSRRMPARRAASSAASRVRRPTPAIVHAIALFMSSTIAGGRESSRAPGRRRGDNCFGGRGEETVKALLRRSGARRPVSP